MAKYCLHDNDITIISTSVAIFDKNQIYRKNERKNQFSRSNEYLLFLHFGVWLSIFIVQFFPWYRGEYASVKRNNC